METKDRLARMAPLAGLAFVVLQLAGVVVAATPMVALGDGQAKILNSFSNRVGTGVWIGAYMGFASVVAFGVFATWVLRARRGPLRGAGLIVTATYMATSVAGLATGGALSYAQAHGMADRSLLVLFYLQSAFFFATWGVGALFLLLVPAEGWLRRSALVIAALLLVALALPTGGMSQFPNMLFLIWTAVASIAWARRPAIAPARSVAGVPAT